MAIQQLHHSLPPLDKPPKPTSREHLEELAEATRKYYGLLKKAKERWKEYNWS